MLQTKKLLFLLLNFQFNFGVKDLKLKYLLFRISLIQSSCKSIYYIGI